MTIKVKIYTSSKEVKDVASLVSEKKYEHWIDFARESSAVSIWKEFSGSSSGISNCVPWRMTGWGPPGEDLLWASMMNATCGSLSFLSTSSIARAYALSTSKEKWNMNKHRKVHILSN